MSEQGDLGALKLGNIPENDSLGWIASGGCGCSDAQRLMKWVRPGDFPGFNIFATDTNKRFLETKFSPRIPYIKRWLDAGRLIRHVLGESVAHGDGAGADPEIGRRAARSKESTKVIKAFMRRHKHLGVGGGVGGGTGSGSLPVIAELAAELMGNRALSVITFPRKSEVRGERGLEALKKIKSHIPTITIYNDHLDDYLKHLTAEEREVISSKETNEVISESSTLVTLDAIREVFQVPGDQKDLDPADLRRVLGMGKDAYISIATIPPEKHRTFTSEEVYNLLVNDFFQRTSILRGAKIAAMRFHGRNFPEIRFQEIMAMIGEHIGRDREIIYGMASEVTDNKMFVTLLVTAPVVEEEDVAENPVIIQEPENPSEPETVPPVVATTTEKPPITRLLYTYNEGRENFEGFVPKPLADRWKELVRNQNATEKDFDQIREDLEFATRNKEEAGKKPDLPIRFRPAPLVVEEPKPSSRLRFLN